MDSRNDGYGQAAAAARAGLSERTGRRIEADPVLPSRQDRTRRYRTRQDPFVEVWREELVPMLQTIPHLRATTILGELQRRHPGDYPDRLLRSLQRRVAYWRATEGPERKLIFRQEHPPGRQALSDFTNGGGLAVTIAGAPFPHLLYHFWLAFSGWARLEPRKACRVYVGLLLLAAMHGCEAALADHLASTPAARPISKRRERRWRRRPRRARRAVSVPAPNPAGYDRLLIHLGEAA